LPVWSDPVAGEDGSAQIKLRHLTQEYCVMGHPAEVRALTGQDDMASAGSAISFLRLATAQPIPA